MDTKPLVHDHPTARLLVGLLGFGILIIGIAAVFS
jgi:hypothetical protein